jgi:predicted house-cleaning noncanonical NTP pyrophosphatase (MazG superfamily)
MKIYNKLIRDNIPELIEKDGQKYSMKILSEEEFKEELLKKLVEEAQEVLEAKDKNKELVKELADVLEVMENIISIFKLDKNEIEKVQNERRISRGGFEKKLFLEYIEE